VGARLRSASPRSIEDLRRQFIRTHHVALSGFFSRSLIDAIAPQAAVAEFEMRNAQHVGSEWVMKPNALRATLNWLMNADDLIRIVRRITGCADIGFFAGRIFRLDPASGQSFHWHDDRQPETRRVAISVNLGTRPHAGGALRIREKDAPETAVEVHNHGAGDAVLFRVADHVEHCVTPVEGTVPRLAFSGWFAAGPSYFASLREHGLEPQA
jgi:2OG-Fe(II) oxygenase superfamily